MGADNYITVAGTDFSEVDGLSTAVLDFTSASNVVGAGLCMWDVVLFTDVIYYAQAGQALPHALSALLCRPGGFAVGVFPADERAGTHAFWRSVEEAGLSWQEAEDTKGWHDRSDRNDATPIVSATA